MLEDQGTRCLVVCRTDTHCCGLPVEHVSEVMRPLPVDKIPGAPNFILGLAVIRGLATPVLDLACLFDQARVSATQATARFIVIQGAERPLALAVAQVQGVRQIAEATVRDMPPLLQQLSGPVTAYLTERDAGLLLMLDSARLLSQAHEALLEISP